MTDTTTPVLETRALVKEYPLGGFLARRTLRALGGVDVSLRSSEILALVGESGSGKSTLARCVTRLEQPTSGEILLDGVDVLKTEKRHASREYRGRVQMVFQDPFGSLNPVHRISHFLERALRNHQPVSGAALQDRLEELMATVDLDANMLASYPHELSGGQRQRVAIARALVTHPTVLLLDEPLAALDAKLREEMQIELINMQKEVGITFIYVTHDQTEALVMSDRIAIMNAGRIEQVGTPREIYTRPASVFASDFIGETNLVRGTVTDWTDGRVTLAAGPVSRLVGRTAAPLTPGTRATLSVRPESIRMVRAEAPADAEAQVDGFLGRVRAVVYLGSRVRVEAVTADGVDAWADLREDEALICVGKLLAQEAVMSMAPPLAPTWSKADREFETGVARLKEESPAKPPAKLMLCTSMP